MEIPPFLETQICEGKAIIFLGSGASLGTKDAKGNCAPSSTKLAELISSRFLGGKYKDYTLDQVGELAISESRLGTVQEYIRDIFEPLEPTNAHKALTTFKWWGLATTNYDRVLEKAYSASKSPQSLCPIIDDTDHPETCTHNPDAVLFLKLHGCITRTANDTCPLILTPDQYITHRNGRNSIFKILEEWAIEHPIIFIGHSLRDSDIRAVLLKLTTDITSRQRHYLVAPDTDDTQKHFWEGKKITVIDGTFDKFIEQLSAQISPEKRKLISARPKGTTPLQAKVAVGGATFSPSCVDFLNHDVEYVKAATNNEPIKPTAFYKGYCPGWSAIEQKLDARRNIADTITTDHFLISGERTKPEVIVIKAHAGAGKTVLLRRLAWDAAHEYGLLALYLTPHGIISTAAIKEIVSLCKERVFLFIDDAGTRVRDLSTLLANIGIEGKMLTIICAEQTGEWNITASRLAPHITDVYDLPYLRENEIDTLLALLDKHNSLGTLKTLSIPERKHAFAEIAGRQLLVALYEATLGNRFEDIIETEYSRIVPDEAQQVYLTVCALNRLGVPVRAGIISRMHGIDFADFKDRLFSPLEDILHVSWDSIMRDFMYRARHTHIAEIVFNRILRNPNNRFDHYIKCLKALNISYSTDRTAFRRMIRGKVIADLFPDQTMARAIYKEAERQAPNDAYYFQQAAVYELNRQNGDLAECERLLLHAEKLSPRDPTIRHSLSEYYLHCAEKARTPLEKDKLLKRSAEISSKLKGVLGVEAPPYHTLLKIGIIRLKDAIQQAIGEDIIANTVKNIEQDLSEGLQLYPGEPYILDAEAQLASLLQDSERAIKALSKAFETNPRNPAIAVRLSNLQKTPQEAESILKRALEANPGDRKLHYAYGKLLLNIPSATDDQKLYHFQRAFTDGDTYHDARLLYARQLFIGGHIEESKKQFAILEQASVSPEIRDRLLYPLPTKFTGEVVKPEASYCFIARDGDRAWIFGGRHNFKQQIWQHISKGKRLSFSIAFNFRGPNAFNIEIST
jgi:tetratricopeptide (TPR) repeat protein